MRKTFSFHSKAVMIWSNERTNGRIRWQMKMGNNFTPNKCKTHSHRHLIYVSGAPYPSKRNICPFLNVIVILKIHIIMFTLYCLQYLYIMRSCHLSSLLCLWCGNFQRTYANILIHSNKYTFTRETDDIRFKSKSKTRWRRIKRSNSTRTQCIESILYSYSI